MADYGIPPPPHHHDGPRIPILKSGLYTITNDQYGAITLLRGALAALDKDSKESVFKVTRNHDSSYTLTVVGTVDNTSDFTDGGPVHSGDVDTDDPAIHYISVTTQAQEDKWVIQPILTGSNPPILFAIYLGHRLLGDILGHGLGQGLQGRGQGHRVVHSHWELLSKNEEEFVKLSARTDQEENKDVPSDWSPEALWIFTPYTPPNN